MHPRVSALALVFPPTYFGPGLDAVVRGERLGTPQLSVASSSVGRSKETTALEEVPRHHAKHRERQARSRVSMSHHRRVSRAETPCSKGVGRSPGF